LSKRVSKKLRGRQYSQATKLRLSLPQSRAYQLEPVEIVSDGAIAAEPVANGMLIPLVILNTERRRDIADLISVHETQPPGDVVRSWARRLVKGLPDDYLVSLVLEFQRPVETLVVIDFYGDRVGLVDQIVQVERLYLQAGQAGDRLSPTLHKAKRIIIEVDAGEFRPAWEEMLWKYLISEFKARGMNRAMSVAAAEATIENGRRLGEIRMRPGPTQSASGESGDQST
jgi:hypothetical protein